MSIKLVAIQPKITVSMLSKKDIPSIKAYMLTQELKDKFVLALWVHRKSMSLEDFITHLKA